MVMFVQPFAFLPSSLPLHIQGCTKRFVLGPMIRPNKLRYQLEKAASPCTALLPVMKLFKPQTSLFVHFCRLPINLPLSYNIHGNHHVYAKFSQSISQNYYWKTSLGQFSVQMCGPKPLSVNHCHAGPQSSVVLGKLQNDPYSCKIHQHLAEMSDVAQNQKSSFFHLLIWSSTFRQ